MSSDAFSSPLSGLHIRYDPSVPVVPGLGTDTLPPAATSIEQLLERQWNEGQQFLLQQGSQADGEHTHTHPEYDTVLYYMYSYGMNLQINIL